MLNDGRVSSEDKLSNMKYVLNYNESKEEWEKAIKEGNEEFLKVLEIV